MQLNTITELLDIPNYKVIHMIQNDGDSLHVLVDQVQRLRRYVPAVAVSMQEGSTAFG